MELTGFTPPERGGDSLPAKEAVDRTLIVSVREHRTGIITKFKPDGGAGVIVDVADVDTDSVWLEVLWMNGAIVDNLAPYVGQAVPISLTWTAGASGGYPYIGVSALDGSKLTAAQTWAQNNPSRFDTERATRGGDSGANAAPAPAHHTQQPANQTGAGAADPNDPAVQALLQQINSGQQTGTGS